MYTKYKISLLFLIVSSFFFYLPVRAASLTFVSDTISNSRPGINANHTIKFTVTNTVPSSGKIVVTPQAGAFTIPAGFNFADIDFLVDGTNRSLDVSPGSGSGSAIGVSVTTGTSGSITFTLNDSDAITTGSVVTIKIGTHASFGATGARQIQNPSGAGSYKVSLQTQNASGGIIDQAQAMVAIQTLVSVGVEVPSAATARVAINSITDNTVPSITANIEIANEGNAPYEYHYEYCVVTTQGNQCGGGDDVAYASAAEEIDAGEANKFVANKTLTVSTAGTYYFKVVVTWGTEKSYASLQFSAVAEPTPTPAPSGGAGGGGGGIIAPPAPVVAVAPLPSACRGADFNLDGKVNSADFSILLFFWKTKPPFKNSCVDLNGDNQVNSIDFSILLYQWGGPGIKISAKNHEPILANYKPWYNLNEYERKVYI